MGACSDHLVQLFIGHISFASCPLVPQVFVGYIVGFRLAMNYLIRRDERRRRRRQKRFETRDVVRRQASEATATDTKSETEEG